MRSEFSRQARSPSDEDRRSAGLGCRASLRAVLASLALLRTVAAPPLQQPEEQTLVLGACVGMSGVSESCTVLLNASTCKRAPCRRLVIIFSGGEMGCVSGAGYSGVMAGFIAHGWAAACINYFETADGSGTVPYFREWDRLNLTVSTVTSGPWGRSFWTGEHLLLQGISHGASSPLVVMARSKLDSQRSWQGSAATAGCFFDGSVDQAATASLLATGAIGGGPCTFPVAYNRWLERYCPSAPASCNLSANADALSDSIASMPASSFFLRTWRLTECGSQMRACTGDIIPRAPFEQLCRGLNSDGRSCEFTSLPLDSHLTCHRDHGLECREWFEGLFPLPTSSPLASTAFLRVPAIWALGAVALNIINALFFL